MCSDQPTSRSTPATSSITKTPTRNVDAGARVWDRTTSPPRLILTTTARDVSWSVAFTPDNRRLVVGLDTGELAFWDLETVAPVMQFKNQGIPAQRILFDPRDHALITLSSNRVIRRPIAPGFMTEGK